MRHLQLEQQVRVMWIDAICINQADNDEKSQQVQMMCDLYKNVRKVTVWLGPPSEQGEFAIGKIKDINFKLNSIRLARMLLGMGDSLTASDKISYMEKLLYDARGRSRFDLRPLADIFGRDWWHRVWILQEARVAAKTYFQCGQRYVSYDDMYSVVVLCAYLSRQVDRNWSPANIDLSKNSTTAMDTLWHETRG
jgi:hypothetical protein